MDQATLFASTVTAMAFVRSGENWNKEISTHARIHMHTHARARALTHTLTHTHTHTHTHAHKVFVRPITDFTKQ
jgi:hypothetical protein